MIKRIYTLLLFIPAMAAGQSYSVEYSFFNWFEDGCQDSDIYYLEIGNTETAQYETLVQLNNCGYHIIDPPANINVPFKPNQIRIRCLCGTIQEQPLVYTAGNEHCFNETISFTGFPVDPFEVVITIQPNLYITLQPNIVSNPLNPYPDSCTPITLSTSSLYETNVYNWEYSLNGGVGWTPLTDFNGIHTFQASIADFPGLAVNQTLQFRMRFCSGQTSNVLTTHFIKCSPDITNLATQLTTCAYNNDGSFTVTFSRALNPGENLLLNLSQNAPAGNPGAILIAAPILTDADLIANSYNFPDTLSAGTYYLRYQLDNDGSVYEYGPFEISAPPPVTFSATWTNVNCFGGIDGSISISASGGVGGYQYEFNGNGDWLNFENPANHTLNNLPPGDYQLRVRDGNGCTEKVD